MATTATRPEASALRLSSRTQHFVLPKQWASMRKAAALEREPGRKVIHLEKGDFQGQEFYPAPHIYEAAARAVHEGHVRYVPGPGMPELRDAIAEEMTRRGRPTVREEVLVTMGAKHALTQSLLTLVDQGDEVIFPNPGYPPDEFWITYAGGKVVYAPLVEPDFHFLLHDPEEEHDCFSDNTHNSHYYDVIGIRNVYLGAYQGLEGKTVKGPSVSDLVRAKSPEADARMRAALDTTVAKMTAIKERAESKERYDQMIGQGNAEGNAVVQAAIDALIAQAKELERVMAVLGLEKVQFEGSDSLDDPAKVSAGKKS